MKTNKTAPEKINWNEVNFSSFNAEEATPEVILSYFDYLSGLLSWFQAGMEYVQKQTIAYSEWQMLLKRIILLWNEHSGPAVNRLFVMITQCGIRSIVSAAKAEKCMSDADVRRVYLEWFTSINYQLEPRARLGIGSHDCTDKESRAMIESLIPVAEHLGEGMRDVALHILALNRFPNDRVAQDMFVKANKKW